MTDLNKYMIAEEMTNKDMIKGVGFLVGLVALGIGLTASVIKDYHRKKDWEKELQEEAKNRAKWVEENKKTLKAITAKYHLTADNVEDVFEDILRKVNADATRLLTQLSGKSIRQNLIRIEKSLVIPGSFDIDGLQPYLDAISKIDHLKVDYVHVEREPKNNVLHVWIDTYFRNTFDDFDIIHVLEEAFSIYINEKLKSKYGDLIDLGFLKCSVDHDDYTLVLGVYCGPMYSCLVSYCKKYE